ncbi:EamA family transporter [Enterococcus saccharolyticus]|uniref:EamA family transporter n=1 Tax=Enterococcus saccharolyticus TaxID=41997 RepID=UPI0039E1EBFA
MNEEVKGHVLAMLMIFILGTTFVSTKLLLSDFSPIEILFCRFFIGLIALSLLVFKRFRWTGWRRELVLAIAGLCGVTLYFLWISLEHP